MLNSEDFATRLQKILEYYDISAAAFADEIDVGRSSISHILSGRNKPSLDFVLKILKAYPEVELYWLLNGKGNFPSKPVRNNTGENFDIAPKAETVSPTEGIKNREAPASGEKEEFSKSSAKSSAGKNIKRIVIFYDDGTFEAFEN